MVGEQDQRRVDGADESRVGGRRQPGRERARHRVLPTAGVELEWRRFDRRAGQDRHHGGHQSSCHGDDRCGAQVRAQRVARARHDHGPAQPVRGAEGARGSETDRLPGHRTRGASPPQQLGGVLVGHGGGQGGRGGPPVDGAVVAQLGGGGRDRGQPGLGGAPTPRALGERLDVVGCEQAAPALGRGVRRQQAPADVGVQGRELHTEPAGGLAALEHQRHGFTSPSGSDPCPTPLVRQGRTALTLS